MASAADIGATASNYTGNANLGGGNFGVIKIDMSPLMQLAEYTMEFNKAEYNQRQKDMERAAAELAEFTAYDPSSPIADHAKQGYDAINDLTKYATDNNGKVLDYRNKKEYAEYNKKKADTLRTVTAIKARAVEYLAVEKEINDETNPEMKKLMKEKLDAQAKSNDIYTPFRLPEHDVKPVVLTAPKTFKVDVTNKGANQFAQNKYTLPDMKDVNNQAEVAGQGLAILAAKKGTEAYDFQVASGKLEPVLTAEHVSSVMAKYVDQNGVFDEAAMRKANAGNTMLIGALDSFHTFNDNMKRMTDGIKNKEFKDRAGVDLAFGFGTLDEKDYRPIDLGKGVITTDDLLRTRIFGMADSIGIDTTIIQHDDAIQNRNLALEAERIKVAWANHGLEAKKLANADNADILAADGVLREMSDIITNGDVKSNMVTVVDANTKTEKEVFMIGDPNILQKFATVDKDGTITRVPDEARFNPLNNEIDLVYFRKDVSKIVVKKDGDADDTTTTQNVSTIRKNKSGGNWIEEIKPLNARTWANMISQRTFGGNDRGKVNEIVQGIITKFGGDVYKLSKTYGKVQQTTTEPAKQGAGTKSKWDKYAEK